MINVCFSVEIFDDFRFFCDSNKTNNKIKINKCDILNINNYVTLSIHILYKKGLYR